jgi:phosphoribosylformylglycinamidine synthase
MKSVFVEKKAHYNTHSKDLLRQLRDQLNLSDLSRVRILNRYDFKDPGEEIYQKICRTILSEPPVDHIYHEDFPITEDETAFAVLYIPGQFDQRADSAAQCIQLITHGYREEINTARIYILKGHIKKPELERVKNYLINIVDSREGNPWTAKEPEGIPVIERRDQRSIDGFISMSSTTLENFHKEMVLSMSLGDLKFCQDYFRGEENRDPSVTEIKVIDTYWSDHCRHTTFTTGIDEILIEEGRFSRIIRETYDQYLESRNFVYGTSDSRSSSDKKSRDVSLMDMAVVGMKELLPVLEVRSGTLFPEGVMFIRLCD